MATETYTGEHTFIVYSFVARAPLHPLRKYMCTNNLSAYIYKHSSCVIYAFGSPRRMSALLVALGVHGLWDLENLSI